MEKKYNNGEALPVETRLKIYEKLLEMYNSGEADAYIRGLCFLAKSMVTEALSNDAEDGFGVNRVYIDEHPYLLPELYKLRTTEKGDHYWYENDQERIEALKKAIKLLTTK